MQGHFSFINRRGLLAACTLTAFSICLFSLSLSMTLSGGSGLWLIPLIISVIIFLLCLMILVSVLTAGVDVEAGRVVFADASGVGGKKAQFPLSQLSNLYLADGSGPIEHPEEGSLVGGRVVFVTSDGNEYVYYPVSITARQYKKLHDGLLEMKSRI